MPRPKTELLVALLALLWLGLICPAPTRAGRVVLKSGFEIPGIPVNVPGLNQKTAAAHLGGNIPQTPYWMVDDGIRRYFVHRQNLAPAPNGVDQSDETSKYPRFKLKHLMKRQDMVPAVVGGFANTSPWDKHGRCMITLRTQRGPVDVHLAITRLDPRYLTVASTSHEWDFGLHLNLLSTERLLELLHTAVVAPDRPASAEDRMSIVLFLLYAEGQLPAAREELTRIRQDFPEMAARADELERLVLDQYGNIALKEVLQRKEIGQHQMAQYLSQRVLQVDLPGDVLREAQQLLDDYAAADQKIAEVKMLLSSLQGELMPEEAARVAAIRAAVERELNYDSLPRLAPFLRDSAAANLTASEKLALAYSAWVIGPSYADTSLATAMSLWDARFLVLQYLHPDTDYGDRQLLQDRLLKTEGISVPAIARMVPLLPSPMEFPVSPSVTVQSVEVSPTLDRSTTVRYTVIVPPEYNPARSYPAIVVLRPEGRSAESAATQWGGTPEKPGLAARRGYVVIAPEYAPDAASKYDYGREAHEAVLTSLFDVRLRINIDSDRVFLTGSGMGGDAAYDLGLSHPDLWAGVMPFTGFFDHAAKLLKDNAPQLPFYAVGGERDRDTLNANAAAFDSRMRRGWDFIYCEYKQRGYEPYMEEFPRLFDWMERHRRPRNLKEFKHTFVRDFENRMGWLKWVGPPPQVTKPIVWGKDSPGRRSMTVEARIPQVDPPNDQTLFIARQPCKHTVVWLSPDLVDYERRLKVNIGATTPFREFPEPDLGVLLDNLRERGDRQMLFWTKLEF
ncbi:MAG: hypothetical protein ACK5Q5_24180 [Planctomycetaceae bacterium]